MVKVRLSAQVQEFQAGMAKAAQATRLVGTEAEKLAQKRQAFDQLGRSALAAGGLMAAGIALAVKKFADFDQAMSNVAATGQDARHSIQALRDAAIEAGASTVFSATESANAIEEMAKAGVNAKDILGGGLTGALDLAAAGGLGVADAAGIAATALKIFNLEGSDMSHVADLLAAGAGKAMGDVQDLSQALAQGGQVAAATGLSIEETTAALSAFASQGLLGSDAGTSFKTMLQRLTPQSREARQKFEELGISAYDANGQFVGLAEFAGQLQTALADLTPEQRNAALAVMFGSDAVRAANVIYQEGESGIRKWTAAVDDQGYAAETAATRLDNLKGDIEALGGAFDSALITMGSAADGPLRGFVQGLTGLVDKFNELPDGGQQAVLAIGAVAAAGSLALGTYLTLVPKIADFKLALDELGPSAQKAAGAVGKIARFGGGALVGVAAAATALDLLTEAIDSIGLSTEDMVNRIGTARDAIDLFQAGITKSDPFGQWTNDATLATYQLENLGEILDKLASGETVGLAGVSALNSVAEISKTLGEIAGDDLERASRQFVLLAESAGLTEGQQAKLLDRMPEFKDALTEQATALDLNALNSNLLKLALGEAVTPTQQAAAEAENLAAETEAAAQQVADLSDALRDFGSPTLDAREAARDFQAAIDDAAASLEENGKTLDDGTEKGRANAASLDAIAEAANRSAAAIIDQTGSEEDAAAALEVGRDALIRKARAFGMSKAEAKAYADSVIADMSDVKASVEDVPGAVTTKVTASGVGAAISQLNTLRSVARDINGTVTTVRVGTTEARAAGGAITGPGTGTSDSIPAMLSNGEHVLTAADVAAMGGQSSVYAWRRQLHGGMRGFAQGGAVSAEEYRDWQRYVRRGSARAAGTGGDGLSLVDRLLDLSYDMGGKAGKRYRDQAVKAEKAFTRLEKQADAAASRLDKVKDRLADLKNAAASMASAVAGAIRRTFDVSAWKATSGTQTVTGTRMVDGVAVTTATQQNVSKPLTAGQIVKDAKAKAAAIKRFADKLGRLRKRGLSGAILEEIAMLGVQDGEPIVDALLKASTAEIRSLNSSYKTADTYAKKAGSTVADANFAALISEAEKARAAAQKSSDAIQKQLRAQTDRLIKALTDALKAGMKKADGGPIIGPGTSTSDSIPAWLSNGENVWSAADVAAHGGQAGVERLKRLTPTAARFAAGGPVSFGTAAGVGRAVEVNFVNPVQRDVQKDAWEAAQIIAAAVNAPV